MLLNWKELNSKLEHASVSSDKNTITIMNDMTHRPALVIDKRVNSKTYEFLRDLTGLSFEDQALILSFYDESMKQQFSEPLYNIIIGKDTELDSNVYTAYRKLGEDGEGGITVDSDTSYRDLESENYQFTEDEIKHLGNLLPSYMAAIVELSKRRVRL